MKVLLFITIFSTLFLAALCCAPPKLIVSSIKTDKSLTFQYIDFKNDSIVQEVVVPVNKPISVISTDIDNILYINYNADMGFCLNYYDVETKTNKIISNITYIYSDREHDYRDYGYQPITSNKCCCTQTSTYTLVAMGHYDGWLKYITLDFEKQTYKEIRASFSQAQDYFIASGYDYDSNSNYVSYVYRNKNNKGELCVGYDLMDASTNKFVNPKQNHCYSKVSKPFEKTIPIMFNATRYLLTTHRDTNEIVMRKIEDNSSTVLFKFPNVADINEPHFSATLKHEWLTITNFNNGKLQVNIINLKNFSSSSFQTTPKNPKIILSISTL
ncbi:hypothetical protein DICPUDRAFT_82620 [Dictyostelium purpureum]|uniref:Uncharacterized protein n=1 Tax=Dictyostelium purpureum TaxID=5786 RepID=F0ZX26_DICPU|nr:uncharacterized protein DICPUDRAFT_82620 [Dictyostelium purpureum]EGC31495.1 hypothetical protein DICPUDRAFT_82620 [Dictyostelium purpureum]|eukprot:XP_003291970.1 hypothetical protein DICPUDRAFT_82620 [Dictyostelium purpureum]